MACATRSASHP